MQQSDKPQTSTQANSQPFPPEVNEWAWFAFVPLAAGILLLVLSCSLLVHTHNQASHILTDLRLQKVVWSETVQLKLAALNRSVGKQCLHIALGNLLIAVGLWPHRVFRKSWMAVLLLITVLGLVFATTVFY